MITYLAIGLVGAVLLVWAVVVVWSGVRAASISRQRPVPRQREQLPAGFTPRPREPDALRDLPLTLLSSEHLRDVTDVLTGTWRGRDVVVADLHLQAGGKGSQHTCVLTRDVPPTPFVWIGPTHADGADVPEGPSPEGIRLASRWQVVSEDPEFAGLLLDEEMCSWLDARPIDLRVELNRGHLLAAAEGRVPTGQLGELLDVATGFRDRIPARALDLLTSRGA